MRRALVVILMAVAPILPAGMAMRATLWLTTVWPW